MEINILTNSFILLSGIVSGFIIFQSFINAPLLFKTLTIEQARPLLRKIFPILFITNAVIGLIMTTVALIAQLTLIMLIVGLVTFIFSAICMLLVATTNRAADENNNDRFRVLHTLSVALTMIIMLINLLWIAIS